MNIKRKLALVFSVAVMSHMPAVYGQVSGAERTALTALHNVTNGDNWTQDTGWLGAAGTECNWFGVVCEGGRVIELNLPDNNLEGEIPPGLGNLTSLVKLDLSRNRLSGEVPPELGSLPQLGALKLNRNLLTGTIPPELGQLNSLFQLDLSRNRLSGSLPPELGQLSQLLTLRLAMNDLTGTIPDEIGQLRTLEVLNLRENRLSGHVPSGVTQFDDLYELRLAGNCLTSDSVSVRMFLSGHASDWNRCRPPERFTEYVSGNATPATIFGGVSTDNGVTYVDRVTAPRTVSVHASIQPEEEHIGQAAMFIVVFEWQGDMYIVNEIGEIELFDENNVRAFSSLPELQQKNPIELYAGTLAQSDRGEFKIFFGYALFSANSVEQIIYNAEPIDLVVQ